MYPMPAAINSVDRHGQPFVLQLGTGPSTATPPRVEASSQTAGPRRKHTQFASLGERDARECICMSCC